MDAQFKMAAAVGSLWDILVFTARLSDVPSGPMPASVSPTGEAIYSIYIQEIFELRFLC